MISFRPIFFILGLLLTTLSVVMMIPALVDVAHGHPDWQAFAASALLTLFIGGALILSNRTRELHLSIRQAFVLTTAGWVVISIFGAFPMLLGTMELTITDAVFEAMSGITTTGSTVIVGLDNAPKGLLLWRALLQWLGGIGIIVMAIAVLPMLRVGGMQLFQMESSDRSEKVLPRITQIAAGITAVYAILTFACTILYWVNGMPAFDAVAHAMTTIATGGFSTSDHSVGVFDNWRIDLVATIFMILGGLPFVLYLQAARGKFRPFFMDSQVRWFMGIVVLAILTLSIWLYGVSDISGSRALQLVSFNVVSIITGTGYTTHAFDQWGGFAIPAFFFLMVVGGCAGSTTCGIKIFRFQVLYATARAQIQRLMHPHGVFIPYYNHKPIPDEVSESVMGFFFLFALSFSVLALALSFLGLDFLTAMSASATAIANVGPGLGPIIGPEGTFQSLPDAAKWVLSFAMLLGRLELFTVLVLFAPAFWRG